MRDEKKVRHLSIFLIKQSWNSPGFPDTSIMPNWQLEVEGGNQAKTTLYGRV